MDPALLGALKRSRLGVLPPDRLENLLAAGRWVDLSHGGQHHREGMSPEPAIVVEGLVRVFIRASDGRRMTVRYAGPGELLAIAALFSPVPAPGGTEALVASRLYIFGSSTLRDLAAHDVLVANALLGEVSDRSNTFATEVAGTYFPSMRERLVRHLLDIASPSSDHSVAFVSQQELADAVGTVREVVVRILRDLRDAGLIETHRSKVRILDAARLHAEIAPPGSL